MDTTGNTYQTRDQHTLELLWDALSVYKQMHTLEPEASDKVSAAIRDVRDAMGGVYAETDIDETCEALYSKDYFPFACTLHKGHTGQHQDSISDAPAILIWD